MPRVVHKAIIGREKELKVLNVLSKSIEPKFLAIYGRRRVGKTYLIEQYFQGKQVIFFEVTGLKDGSYKEQLGIFRKALIEIFYPGVLLKEFANWLEALEQLTLAIETMPKNKRIVIFFDELPWLATQKSGFMQAIDHYWNTKWSKRSRLLFIACGSAASWMIDKLIHARGGLHNRIDETILLQPFNLKETRIFLKAHGVKKDLKHILRLYLTFGGVAHYLKQINKNESVVQNINHLCFTPNGKMFIEFDELFKSLFSKADIHEELIKVIGTSNNGISREEIINRFQRFNSGGYLTKCLVELEKAGFITSFVPYGNINRGVFYKVSDEYVLFYLRWILPAKNKLKHLKGAVHYWENMVKTPAYNTWLGLAFETICYRHLDEIIKILRIKDKVVGVGNWRYTPKQNSKEKGVQIDLIIDRSDDCINICEIKSSQDSFVITKSYAEKLQNKINVFKKKIGTTKEILLTFITLNGLITNKYSTELVNHHIKFSDLFED